MPLIRAFIAVEIDNQAKKQILGLISRLKTSRADAKWITDSQMHITLKFLGNISADKIQGISGAISCISSNFKSFTVSFSKIGAFPSMDRPRVIWLGIDKGASLLKSLADKIDCELELLGFARDPRDFKPHLTLARIKSPENIRDLVKSVGETETPAGKDMKINKLILFQSNLTPLGPIHTIIQEKNLTG